MKRLSKLLTSSPLVFLLLALVLGRVEAANPPRNTGPWNLETLKKTPPATWGPKTGLLEEVYYEGEPLAGKPTRVFAYYARPEGEGPLPAMVLVHGGGGKAFAEWATLWANRGYAALAMDLAGCGPDGKRLPDGGPPQDDDAKFAEFTPETAHAMWTYHAVAAVIRGHSLLASCKEVDPNRIGITGISWGGYLTSIVAGLDDRLKVAVPVYGCGFLHENSAWMDGSSRFSKITPEQRAQWVKYFDPSRYLPGVRCPILFLNGTNDAAYPLDSHQKSRRLVPGRVDRCITPRMPHSHVDGWAPKEIGIYVDSVLRAGDPLPVIEPIETADGKVTARFTAKVPVVKGQLHYTTDTGRWQDRQWKAADAQLGKRLVSAELPKERPLTYFLNLIDQRDATVSTDYAVLP
jgi:dienelactone hydrolase